MEYQNWFSKALENLTAAQLCFTHGHYNACANRVYYAMFQAGAAALIKHTILPPEGKINHIWLQSNFSGMLIHRRKVFRQNLGPTYLMRKLSVI